MTIDLTRLLEQAAAKKAKAKKEKLDPAKNKIEVNPKLALVYEVENRSTAAVVTFGRMNPPTIGHERVAMELRRVAAATHGKPIIYLSAATGDSKNPLPPERKRQLVATAFQIETHIAKNPFEMMRQLSGKYDVVHIVVGQDRTGIIDQLLKYNGIEFNFKDIQVHNAGNRDTSSGVSGMSASKMREFARKKDSAGFTSGLPVRLRKHSTEIMSLIEDHLEYEQAEQLDEATMTMSQRLKRGQLMRRLKVKIQIGRRRALKKRADSTHLVKRSRAAAKNFFRKRMLGGRSYGTLSLGARAALDSRLKTKTTAIHKLSKRLLPKYRRAEMSRKLGSSFTGAGAKTPLKEGTIQGGHVARKNMPQIKDVMMAAAKIGAEVTTGHVNPHNLKIVQKDFDDSKVKSIAAYMTANPSALVKPIVVSACGHLIDGHHRALAAMQLGHDSIPAHTIHADIDTVIDNASVASEHVSDKSYAAALVEAVRASLA